MYQKYDDFDDFIKTHYSELADNIKQSVLRENEQNRQRIITLANNKNIRFPKNVKSDIDKIELSNRIKLLLDVIQYKARRKHRLKGK